MTTPLDQAAIDAAQEQAIRDLATQITQMTKLGFDPMTIRKGIIAAVDDNASPPTVSLNISGDTGTLITQVRTLNNYTPINGQTVLIAKQGTEIFLLGAISAGNPYSVNTSTDNGWQRATLSNGSHGGNSNGDIYYRRVLDHGAWKMQWRGGWNVSGTSMIASGDALASDYRPSSLRSLLVARDAGGGAVAAKLDFATNGTVSLVGGTTGPASSAPGGSTDSVDPVDVTTVSLTGYQSAAGSDLGHDHGVVGGHWHSVFVNSHTHSVTAPTWISLNGVEYFL